VQQRLQQFLSSLNEEQRTAVTAADGPVLVLAGAGSGKTRVLTGRAFYLVAQQRVHPHSVLVVTFTNKAAEELRGRLRSYMGEQGDLPWAGTFHSFCARLLRTYGEAVGLPREFSIYDTADTDQVLTELLNERRIGRDELSPATLRSWISLLKNGGSLSGHSPFHRLAHDLLPRYDERLRLAHAVDFDDLLRLPLDIFHDRLDLLETVQRRYDHILIDEFQDTNRHQYDLAKLIAAPQNNLYVVGDDDQSIYGWRGAQYRNVYDFQKELPGALVFRLEQNYRSTQPILDIANDVIAGNSNREEKRLWTERTQGEKAVLRQVSRAVDEAHEVVGEIHHLQRSKGYAWKDFAVLFRVNALSRMFEEVLISQAIPYTIVGGTRFYERKEVKDLLAYLRVLVNTEDEQAWRRVLRTPPRGIGNVTLKQLESEARRSRQSIGRVLMTEASRSTLSKPVQSKLLPVAEKIGSLKVKIAGLSLTISVETVLEDSGLVGHYESLDTDETEDRVANLAQLVEAARDREREHPEYSLTDFLSEIALISDIDDFDETPDRVTLMTIHAAKGLEFPVVFVAGLEEKLLPHQRSTGSVSEVEEERRLFYVAVTRAQERLYLTYSQMRYVNGTLEFQEPSRFLYDITPEHLRGWSLPGSKASRIRHDEDDSFELQNEIPRLRSKRTTTLDVSVLIPYKIGDVVEHPEFGIGVVTAKSGDAGDLRIRVAFQGIGSKLLAVKFAPLKKIS
jgi:DNA helicase II / ATP-dependent DNA helicase PcrA